MGRLHFQSAHATLAQANEEAQALCEYILEEEDHDERGEIMSQGVQPNGFFKGEVRLSQDDDDESIDTCVITVEVTWLQGGTVIPDAEGESRKRQRTDEPENDDVEEEDYSDEDAEEDEDKDERVDYGVNQIQRSI